MRFPRKSHNKLPLLFLGIMSTKQTPTHYSTNIYIYAFGTSLVQFVNSIKLQKKKRMHWNGQELGYQK